MPSELFFLYCLLNLVWLVFCIDLLFQLIGLQLTVLLELEVVEVWLNEEVIKGIGPLVSALIAENQVLWQLLIIFILEYPAADVIFVLIAIDLGNLEGVERRIVLGVEPCLLVFVVYAFFVHRLAEPDQEELLEVVSSLLAFFASARAVEEADEPLLLIPDLRLIWLHHVVLKELEVNFSKIRSTNQLV